MRFLRELIPTLPARTYLLVVPSDRGASRGIVRPEGIAGFASRTVAGPSGAEVPTSSGLNRQARPRRTHENEADPQTPVRGAERREVVAVRHFDIDSTSARSRRLRTPQGSAHPLGCSPSPKPRRQPPGRGFRCGRSRSGQCSVSRQSGNDMTQGYSRQERSYRASRASQPQIRTPAISGRRRTVS